MERVFGALGEVVEEAEVLREEERAVVMEVVAHEPVRNGCLWRCGLERGMRIDHAHRRVEAGIGDAEHANVAVVVRNVLHEPVDGVVGVGALVDFFRALVWIERADVNVITFGAIAAADVLRDEDELVLRQFAEGAERIAVVVRAVGLQRIRRAREHDGPRLRIILRHIDASEELHAVAHGDAMLELGVVFREPDGVGVGRSIGAAGDGSNDSGERKKKEHGKARGVHARDRYLTLRVKEANFYQ